MDPHLSRRASARKIAALTLVEVVIALLILALALGGVLAALVQSRRLTEGSVSQNSALTVVQRYVEQMKNMELKKIVNSATDPASGGTPNLGSSFTINTRYKEPPSSGADDGLDPLQTSTGTPPDLSTLTPGVTPSGVVDNLKDFPDNSGTQGAATAWSTIWPGARNYPTPSSLVQTSTAYPGDLHLNMWVWVKDLSGTTSNAAEVYGITVIYTWQYKDGAKVRYLMGTVRSIRSAVPSF
jgi:type II secretory pathway pseudopilin PulG